MPSVRDILKGSTTRAEAPAELAQGVGSPVESPAEGPSTTQLLADRIRQAADQRVALARQEIDRLQVHLDQLQDRLEDHQRQNLPTEEIQTALKETTQKLDDAKADLTRAQEAKRNTELATSVKQGRNEGLDLGPHVSVRQTLGPSTPAPAVSHGPARKL